MRLCEGHLGRRFSIHEVPFRCLNAPDGRCKANYGMGEPYGEASGLQEMAATQEGGGFFVFTAALSGGFEVASRPIRPAVPKADVVLDFNEGRVALRGTCFGFS